MRNQALAVMEFIEQNLIGRTLNSEPISARTDDGLAEVTYSDQTFFSNLVRRAAGFDFNLTTITLGRRFRLNADGQRTELAGSMDAVRLYRYEMTARVSTGQLLGFIRLVSSTNEQLDPLAGTCSQVQMRLEDGALVVNERQIGYGDFPAPGGGRKPQALDYSHRYSVDDRGTLSAELEQEAFDVDPESFERRPSGDRIPTQTLRELVNREGEPVPI
jgi:hypothetical protein